MLEIASIEGNKVSFTTPLHITFDTAHAAQLSRYTIPYGARYAGVERLHVHGGKDDNITLRFAMYSWVRNVESDWSTGDSFALDNCFRDSSVALKWFVPEIHSEQAASLLDDSIQLAAPDLLYPEAGNIVWKKVGRGELEAEDAREIVAGLKRMPIAVTSSSLLLEAALDIALAHRRTVYASLYAALAVAHDCIFVTADDRECAGGWPSWRVREEAVDLPGC